MNKKNKVKKMEKELKKLNERIFLLCNENAMLKSLINKQGKFNEKEDELSKLNKWISSVYREDEILEDLKYLECKIRGNGFVYKVSEIELENDNKLLHYIMVLTEIVRKIYEKSA